MTDINTLSVNAIRVLAADEVQKANSGHPGLQNRHPSVIHFPLPGRQSAICSAAPVGFFLSLEIGGGM